MTELLALDLFCGAGGACVGLQAAGFRAIGVDIEPQPDYPGEFVLADALRPPFDLSDFPFIWASPPCQGASRTAYWRQGKGAGKREYPDLIQPTREMLAGHPGAVIENVTREVLPDANLVLSGRDFGLPQLRRRRFFECAFDCNPPLLAGPMLDGQPLMIDAFRYEHRAMISLTNGAGNAALRDRRRAAGLPPTTSNEEKAAVLGIDHIVTGTVSERRKRIAQCIPPVYAYHIAREFIRWLEI